MYPTEVREKELSLALGCLEPLPICQFHSCPKLVVTNFGLNGLNGLNWLPRLNRVDIIIIVMQDGHLICRLLQIDTGIPR